MATKKSADGASAPKKKARSSTAKKATAKKAKKAPAKASKKPAGKKTSKKAKGTGAVDSAGPFTVEREIGGRTLTLETGRMAKLSDGAVLARYGDTVVFAAANSTTAPDFMDFFPLTVDYREKTSAMGVIPGGFFKREGRPSTKEILTCRIIDRSIRPMFPDGFRRDVQVLSQVIASDRENDGDVVAAIASFAALAVSSLPHGRSLGCVRMGYIDGKTVVNPVWSTSAQMQAERLEEQRAAEPIEPRPPRGDRTWEEEVALFLDDYVPELIPKPSQHQCKIQGADYVLELIQNPSQHQCTIQTFFLCFLETTCQN